MCESSLGIAVAAPLSRLRESVFGAKVIVEAPRKWLKCRSAGAS